jgi:hypothetical protein
LAGAGVVDLSDFPPESLPPESLPPESFPPESFPPESFPPESLPPEPDSVEAGVDDSPGTDVEAPPDPPDLLSVL